ncbi:Hypothetical protein I595_908 [Croceitalea dokdonensis DOKDO 023]|uniref:DUF5723 domain-containing protein n=1 Tax=Croceitalea dokdonensis DOKDO 023 TaxID=1300341 RepID=A0A0P7AKX2_9FLAO|nr:DUF5723 family protein [Croceitalea dokdonensis]KPM32490.1 Hypothetical protein I595_908 [Croceitalea dokdonensis DOKDO 023]
MRWTNTFLWFIALWTAGVTAQNKQLLYDFYEVPQSLLLNPGVITPYQWHAGVPLLSGLSVQAGSSGIAVNDIFANDGIDFTTKFRERVVNGLSPNDVIGGSGQIEVFSGGFRSSKRPTDYYSFGMYGEGFIAQYWPSDLAQLAFEGNANNIGRRFQFNHLTTGGEAVNVFHFGINRQINNRLTAGLRFKVYSSVFEFTSKGNDGYFVTTQGENNILRNTVVADVTMRTSGVESLLELLGDDTLAQSVELPRWLLGRSLLGGNLGVGLDFGFTKRLGSNSYFTISVLDIGFIYHNNDVKNYTLNGAGTNEGIEIILPEDLGNLSVDIWQDLVDDFEERIPLDTNADAFFSLRPTQLNASYRYHFGEYSKKSNCDCDIAPSGRNINIDYKNAVGAQLFMIHRPRGPQAALTAFYQKRLGNVLALKGTYTMDKYSFANLGLGVSMQAGPVNFYLMADNLLGYQNLPASNYASLQFGLNILSWNPN